MSFVSGGMRSFRHQREGSCAGVYDLRTRVSVCVRAYVRFSPTLPCIRSWESSYLLSCSRAHLRMNLCSACVRVQGAKVDLYQLIIEISAEHFKEPPPTLQHRVKVWRAGWVLLSSEQECRWG